MTPCNSAALLSDSPSAALRVPEKSAADLALACAMAVLGAISVWHFHAFAQFHFDDGIVLQGAVRIADGQLPYRDFFSFYTPGSYYLYAGLFQLFGTSLLVAQTVLVLYAASFSLLTFLLARRACSRMASLCASLLLTAVCLPGAFVNGHSWDSTAAASVTLYLATWWLQKRAGYLAFLCGFMAAATAMIDQARGCGLIFGLVVAGMAARWLLRERWSGTHAVAAIAGGAVPISVVIAYFAAHQALRPMIAGWSWPLSHYAAVNKLPFGYLLWSTAFRDAFDQSPLAQRGVIMLVFAGFLLVIVIPVLLAGLTGVLAIGVWRRRIEPTPTVRFVIFCGCILVGVLTASAATTRADWHHVVTLGPLFFFMVPMLGDRRLLHLPTLSRLRPVFAIGLLISLGLANLLLSFDSRHARYRSTTRRGNIKTNSPDQVLPYLQAHVRSGERLLVYPYVPLYTFLTATNSPTRFEYLQPGLHTPAEFEEARQQLAADQTPVVLFQIRFRDQMSHTWPATPAAVVASDPMGDYIFDHYKVCKTLFGAREPFAYMVRTELSCPF